MALRVFIVEDDEAVRDSLQVLLDASGFATVGFEAGDTFLQMHEVAPCDCVILDLNLPGKITGLEVLAELSEPGSIVPVVIVTGEYFPAPTQAYLKDKAFAYLEKPVPTEELLAVLRHATGTS